MNNAENYKYLAPQKDIYDKDKYPFNNKMNRGYSLENIHNIRN